MRHIACLMSLLVVGCAAETVVEGQATYVKPASEGGQKVAPQEKSDDLVVTAEFDASGTFDAVDALLCKLTSGSLSFKTATSTTTSSDGSFASSFDATVAAEEAKSPVCGALSNVKLTGVTSITLKGSMPTNETNCSAFCKATADHECAGEDDEAQCTSEETADCKVECKSKSKIVGSGKASASAVAEANDAMDSSGNTSATVELVFTKLE